MDFKHIVRRQILPSFVMVKELLDGCSDQFLESSINGYPVVKLIYHPLYWLHQHLSHSGQLPADFDPGQGHSLDHSAPLQVSRRQLQSYLSQVETDVESFLAEVEADYLKPNGNGVTVLDKLMGQIRHSCYHIGALHMLMFSNSLGWPEYRGPQSFTPDASREK